MREKVKVGELGEDLVLLGVLGLVGYFAVTKLFNTLTPPPTSGTTNNAANAASATQAAAADLAAAAAANSQSLTNNQISSMASTLSGLITNYLGNENDLANMVETVELINNQTDWAALVSAFGVQKFNSSMSYWSWCELFGYDCSSMNLPAALTLVLRDTSYQKTLNDFFTGMGINQQV